MGHHFFQRTVVSLLRVYLVEGRGTSVELHILTTHLHSGESGSHEVLCTEEWVEVHRGMKVRGAATRDPGGPQCDRELERRQ
jgi:hypothetical protein